MTKKETAIKFESQNIKTFAEPAYLAYAMKVVKDRAIPDVRDGLKPVQRRILYSMYQLKLLSDTAKPMKCARVVGDTIGRFHPHGDSAVYEAMVRMSQPFTLRYPLVLGEGNFGSRDGDKAAAMRYTEAKLTPIASTLLDELKWDTVDYKPNYDNVLNEPSVLPSRLPFVLLNGSSGIAVGMATNLLSHNLNEVVNAAKYIISHKRLSNDKILSFMPAPDFPSGGQIISSLEDIKKIYETGRGSIRVRAKYYIEKIDKKSKNKRLVVNELPPDTSTAKIMTSIALLMDPPQTKKGKKITLKPEQLKLKKVLHDMIGKVRDGSDQDHPIHLIIEPKNQKVDLEELFKILCTFTDMEMNVSANFVCIDSKGNPKQSGIIDWLCQWCDFRVETVRRRLQDEKSRIDKQLHIINGRLSILDKIEEVIQILKSSENPKKDLMESFGLDEIQAEDVLEMKLRQVANLEKIKLLEKQEKLSKEQSRLLILLTDETKLKKEVINELSEDAKTFGDERRTELKPSEFFSHQSIFDLMIDSSNGSVDKSNLDKLSVAFTHRGWLSWQVLKQNNSEDNSEAPSLDTYEIKHGDTIKHVHCGSLLDYLLILSKKGKIYSLNLMDIQNKYNKKTGTVPLTEFFDIKNDDEFYQSLIVDKEDKIFLACSSGYGFISKAENAINRMKSGKQFLSVSKNYRPLQMEILDKKLRDKQSIVITLSSDGKSVVFPLDDVKEIPKGKGVCFMGLSKDHYMKDYKIKYNTQDLNLEHTNTRNNKKLVKLNFDDLKQLEKPRTAGRKGKALVKYPDTICFR